jgi:bifunctional oligoribonuclease and PAP phosphatase NrnA
VSIQTICRSIKKYNNFLIVAHTNPEGDALGSQLGFYNLVKKLGKQATILSDDELPYGYDFLPGLQYIKRLDKQSRRIKFDCLAVLDCADLKRTGGVYKLKQNQPVLNIDHHISNQNFGDENWVDPQASSCSEMIYRLYKKMRLSFDRNCALVLYTGIMTDTGSFHYSTTSSATFSAASELLKFGVKPAQVYRYAYENIPPQEIKPLFNILSGVKFFAQGRIAVFEITGRPNVKNQAFDLADQVLNFGRLIKGVEVVALFKENLGKKLQVRVNLRSQGRVDVNKVAAFLGGGGHKRAAGCTVSGSVPSVKRKVIAQICSKLK